MNVTLTRVVGRVARGIAALGVGLAALTATTAVTAPAAHADRIASAGPIGPYATNQLHCRHRVFGGGVGVLHAIATPPRVLAPNLRAGAGNDGAWVRYATVLFNEFTGQAVTKSGWSRFAWATDNRLAPFPVGADTHVGDARGHYKVVYYIQWWRPGASQPFAQAHERVQNYLYINRNNVQGGVWRSCFMRN